MLYGPIDFVQKSNSASLTILLYRLFTLLSTDGDNNNTSVIMEMVDGLLMVRSDLKTVPTLKNPVG